MKRIGLVGGLSPESTVEYYQYICRKYNKKHGHLNFGIEVLIPSEGDRQFINDNIWNDLSHGNLENEDRERIHAQAILDYAEEE